jgi:dTDP-glucose 4,6-dehydratase
MVSYKESEGFTTKDKKIDVAKAVQDLKHKPKVHLKEGIPLTIEWQKSVYNI